jgi:hypothetical protein
MSVNIFISASSASGAVLPVPPFRIEVGQLEPCKFVPLPYCPTFFTSLSCIEKKLKARMRAIGANTCPLRSCVHNAGEGWTVGHPSNDAACTCPTSPNGSRTRPDSRTVADGLTPRVMQPSPSASLRCSRGHHATDGSRSARYTRSATSSATESFHGCSSAPRPPTPTQAPGAC